MPVPLGVGAGDFIAVAKLAGKIITELKKNGEAVSKYQNLLIELEGLSRALSRLNTLSPTEHELQHLDAIRAATAACKRPLKEFLEKIAKFDSSLGTWDAKEKRFRGVGRRIQFSLALEEDVKELRATLMSHSSTINMLLLGQVLDSLITAETDRAANKDQLKEFTTSLSEVRDTLSTLASHTGAVVPVDSRAPNKISSNTRSASSGLRAARRDRDDKMTQEILALDDELNAYSNEKSRSKMPSANTIVEKCSKLASIGLAGSAMFSMQNTSIKPQEMSQKPFCTTRPFCMRRPSIPPRENITPYLVDEPSQHRATFKGASDCKPLVDELAPYIDVTDSADHESTPARVQQRQNGRTNTSDAPNTLSVVRKTYDPPPGARKFQCTECASNLIMDLRFTIYCVVCFQRYGPGSIYYDQHGDEILK